MLPVATSRADETSAYLHACSVQRAVCDESGCLCECVNVRGHGRGGGSVALRPETSTLYSTHVHTINTDR